MDRLQFVSLLAAVALLLIVLELVRRRRLLERYALLWLGAAVVIARPGGLAQRAGAPCDGTRHHLAPNALFFVALGFILVLLLHFSAAVSRLTDQSKVLAQRLALLEERTRHLDADALPDVSDRELLEETRSARFTASAGSRDRG